ncbi:MAG TPA: GTPase ObgE [Solirubrobacterales bacterium]|nr:GTPase ObgE [Solirubrobacterales bacterium]
MLFDRAKIYVEGGRGGNGVVSFRREAHVPRGGPDGGDGGRGGDVILVCDPQRRDLSSLGRSRHFRAGRGEHGKGKRKHGERGGDRVIPVPPGTVVRGIDDSEAELLEHGQRLVVARGGSGGHGNKRFATSTRQAPRFAERGLQGESGDIELRLKLLADVGLVGLPNSGKSSLLARLTRAAPKVANYPFTTVEPNLGTIELDARQLVIADIPGLIEGAAQGAGLGHEFLAHLERCRLLVHLVEIAPTEGDPRSNYEAVRHELEGYGAGLDRLPDIVALSKIDLVPAEEAERMVEEWRQRLEPPAIEVLGISSATGAGLDELKEAIFRALPESMAPEQAEARGRDFEVEHRTYRPGEEEGFEIVAEGEGRFRVNGRGIEMLIARHDLDNPEALEYLEGRLREIGVIAELQRAGFEPGDEVVVGEVEFELDPS